MYNHQRILDKFGPEAVRDTNITIEKCGFCNVKKGNWILTEVSNDESNVMTYLSWIVVGVTVHVYLTATLCRKISLVISAGLAIITALYDEWPSARAYRVY